MYKINSVKFYLQILYIFYYILSIKSHHYFNLLSCCPDQILAIVNSIAIFCLEFFILSINEKNERYLFSLFFF